MNLFVWVFTYITTRKYSSLKYYHINIKIEEGGEREGEEGCDIAADLRL